MSFDMLNNEYVLIFLFKSKHNSKHWTHGIKLDDLQGPYRWNSIKMHDSCLTSNWTSRLPWFTMMWHLSPTRPHVILANLLKPQVKTPMESPIIWLTTYEHLESKSFTDFCELRTRVERGHARAGTSTQGREGKGVPAARETSHV